ncbi:hypothetical protein ES703_112408 [subsurface metagenome]
MEIKQILSDLESLKSHPDYKEGVRLNIEFFKAIRNPFSYVWWLMFRAPKLRKARARIVELADLPLPRWQKELLETLSWFEIWMLRVLQPMRKQIIRWQASAAEEWSWRGKCSISLSECVSTSP